MSIVNFDSTYNIDLNFGYFSFIASGLSANTNITLPDASAFDIEIMNFFNNDGTYNITILPYSGSSIVNGNPTLGNYEYISLFSFNNVWYRI